ncbi:hypothetical protein TNIN_473461 [Trichonephila inaurata madagascariensis]|uniref:Uncharacterized protein n=1 Tax=Trichonephila inaurata madagascariensis TaxID=2747483 RepID=A0A8X7C4R4_9ARAC|nr:hypothetical protein TNIN_473461 [Trichonephila inaurata madagascariensis]
MFKGDEKEDIVVVLGELGETVDPNMNVEDLKQKLMQSKAYLEGKEFLDTTIEERMEEEERRKRDEEHRMKMEKYRKREEYRKYVT